MTHTTFGRLNATHHGKTARILQTIAGRTITAEGIIEDIGHYLPQGVTSVRFIGENQGIFRPHDYAIEITDHGDAPDDAILDLAGAIDAASLAVPGMRPDKLRGIVESASMEIISVLANQVAEMCADIEGINAEEDNYEAGQAAALAEVAAWLREIRPAS